MCFLLSLCGEAFAAFWAGYLDPPFSFWYAQDITTTGAFEEFMCFSLFKVSVKLFDFCLYRPPVAYEFIVFGSAFCYITG